MHMHVVLCVVVVALAALAGASRPVPDEARRGERVLVVLGAGQAESGFGTFLGSLRASGLDVAVRDVHDTGAKIDEFDEFLYDHLVLLGVTGDTIGAGIDASKLVAFVNKGGNVLVAGAAAANDLVRELASQCGVEYDAPGTNVIDHFNFVPELDGGKHTAVVTSNIVKNPHIFPSAAALAGPIVSEGPAVAAGGELAFEVVRGESTAYAGPTGKALPATPFAMGHVVGIAVAVQALNNARAVFAGSVDLFSDRFAAATVQGKATANTALTAALAQWAFQRTGVLRISNSFHHRAGDTASLSWYRIKDDMVYEVDIEQRAGAAWVPYKAADVQMEAIMLDPYLRTNFTHNDKGHYVAAFRLPDVYGMFTLQVKYYRRGLSYLEAADIISVRPFRHNEYERFIQAAYPYYTSSFVMIAVVVAFSIVFLYHRDKVKTQ